MVTRSKENTRGTPAERLRAVLQQAAHEGCEMEEVLEREASALAQRDVEALTAASHDKQRLGESLERLGREQLDLVRTLGFAATAEGMDAVLAQWDAQGQMRTHWTQLRESMERCRLANQANGQVVWHQQKQVVQALRALRGVDMQADLYDPHGRTVSDGPSRHISKA